MSAPVRLPIRFYDDHVARDLPAGDEVRRTSRHVYVVLTEEERAELLSDARHYATTDGLDPSLRGLVSSARATVRALEASR